jgi:hypothetical protein
MVNWVRNGLIALVATQGLVGAAQGFAWLAQSRSCPNVCASNVDARIVESADASTCGFGIVIFGFGGGLWGEDCPEFRLLYPAHQECRGATNPGTRCVPETALTVQKDRCDCYGVLPIIESGFPLDCDCTPDAAGGGTVEDFKTEVC